MLVNFTHLTERKMTELHEIFFLLSFFWRGGWGKEHSLGNTDKCFIKPFPKDHACTMGWQAMRVKFITMKTDVKWQTGEGWAPPVQDMVQDKYSRCSLLFSMSGQVQDQVQCSILMDDVIVLWDHPVNIYFLPIAGICDTRLKAGVELSQRC